MTAVAHRPRVTVRRLAPSEVERALAGCLLALAEAAADGDQQRAEALRSAAVALDPAAQRIVAPPMPGPVRSIAARRGSAASGRWRPVPRSLWSAVPVDPQPSAPAVDALATLTRRQREVADLVACGLSNRQIADDLRISERTAETHVQNILVKLGFASRAQIATLIGRRELLDGLVDAIGVVGNTVEGAA